MSTDHTPDTLLKLPQALRRSDLILIFALALILRLVFFAASNDQSGTQQVIEECFDCGLYLKMGISLAYGSMDVENGFFYFGPGYACFLALNLLILGRHVVPIILVNILISSLSCLLIYLLAIRLTRSYAVSIIAALLAATSYTSIVLSCLTMSDTWYFFVFLAGLLIFLKALESERWLYFILTGVFAGAAALTRPVGQFWPILMVVIAVSWRILGKRCQSAPRVPIRGFVLRVAVAVAIAGVIISSWMIRNYRVHGVYTLSIAGANGPANVAAVTIERLDGTPSNEVLAGWRNDYIRDTGDSAVSLGELFHIYSARARATFDTLGWEMIKTYLKLDWENLNQINYMHRILIPKLDHVTIPLEALIMGHYLNYVSFVLSMLGFVVLLATGRVRTAIVLGSVYFYYAVTIGAYRWQYSRYFFPGQIAWAILISVVIVFAGKYIIRRIGHIRAKIFPRVGSPAP